MSEEDHDTRTCPALPARDVAGALSTSVCPADHTVAAEEAPRGAGLWAADLLGEVNLEVEIELGRTRMLVEDVLRLAEGSVVALDKLAGDPVDILLNGRLVARGDVVVIEDRFAVRLTEVVSTDREEAAC